MPEEQKTGKSAKANSKENKEEKFATKVMTAKPAAIQEAPKEMKAESKPEPPKEKGNPWIVATIILLLISIVLAILLVNNYSPVKKVSKDVAAQEVASLVKDAFGVDMELDSVEEKDDLYEINYQFSGRKFLIYATKDLSFVRLPNGNWIRRAELAPEEEVEKTEETLEDGQEPKDAMDDKISGDTLVSVTKSEKPKIELFVMSLCPYALQAEKGILPAADVLKEKIDFKIKYMHYILLGAKEDEENKRQICIREEQETKFIPYLRCFLNTSKSFECIKTAAVDSTKVDTCIKSKALGYYLNDSKISKAYNIESSPTLVINGKKVEFFPRAPSTALDVLCSALTTKPAECSKELSSDNPSANFGSGIDDKNIEAFCG